MRGKDTHETFVMYYWLTVLWCCSFCFGYRAGWPLSFRSSCRPIQTYNQSTSLSLSLSLLFCFSSSSTSSPLYYFVSPFLLYLFLSSCCSITNSKTWRLYKYMFSAELQNSVSLSFLLRYAHYMHLELCNVYNSGQQRRHLLLPRLGAFALWCGIVFRCRSNLRTREQMISGKMLFFLSFFRRIIDPRSFSFFKHFFCLVYLLLRLCCVCSILLWRFREI